MKQSIIILFLISLLLCGCKSNDDKSNITVINSAVLKNLLLSAINGENSANNTLGKIIDINLPINNNYNELKIDSITLNNGNIYYYILLAYPNPIYNRFAVYDRQLIPLIIDESLNGIIKTSHAIIGGNNFIMVMENFISKDVFNIERTSLYKVDTNSVHMVFRSLTKFENGKIVLTQQIDEISPGRIRTSIKGSAKSVLSNKSDIFLFNSTTNTYDSANDLFSKFVFNQITNYKGKIEKPLITDPSSALKSVGVNTKADTSTAKNNSSYSLTFPKGWKELNNLAITEYLKKELKGSKYLNDYLGAHFSVMQIPSPDSAEVYTKNLLKNAIDGKYKVRFSDKIEKGKVFVQFFEYTCGSKKFLLIFVASKYTYEKYKKIYENILNSFYMEC